jgi:chlorobactene glucosyltransferase
MLIYNLIITAILPVLAFIALWNLFILRKKKIPKIADDKLPFVSVLIPARNEEFNIKNVLSSILEQDYPDYEVIVLNDSSEDKTGDIIDALKKVYPRLKSITGKPLEKGWTGKCYACSQLDELSKGEWILFTDADTTHYKNSVRDSIELALHRNADMLTLLPRLTMISMGEKIVMPMLMFTIMCLLPFYFVDKQGFKSFSIGVGPFMLFKREAYDKIGGHSSVKNALVEDVTLGRKVKKYGLRLIAGDGRNILSVRMYRSFAEIWNGFSKNIFAGFEFSNIRLFTVNLLYFSLFILPFMLFIIDIFMQFGSKFDLFLLVFQIFLIYLIRVSLSIKFKLGFLSTILHPLGALAVPVIALNSWRWIIFGSGAKWKGRVYNSRPEKN